MDQEEIMNLDPALQEDDVGSQTNTHLQDFVARKREMGWEEVHKVIKGAPFFACNRFYYTDDFFSKFDQEDIFIAEADQLEILLLQPLFEYAERPEKLVEELNQELFEELDQDKELEEIEMEDLLDLMVSYLLQKDPNCVSFPEAWYEEYPAIMAEMTKNSKGILPLCRKLIKKKVLLDPGREREYISKR